MERLRFFLYSCANWGFGYFNAYDVGARYDLDFWVHLGDYVRTRTCHLLARTVYYCLSVGFWVLKSKHCLVLTWPGSEGCSCMSRQGLAVLTAARHVSKFLQVTG